MFANSTKRKYEIGDPIGWFCNRCRIYPFPIKISAKKFDADCQTISYISFINFREHRVVTVKLHFHHSHVTGKFLGYGHDFCNIKVKENQNHFSCIVHNFLGFDMFFLPKGIWLSVWGTKDQNVGWSGLKKFNFPSLGSQVKFIDSMK